MTQGATQSHRSDRAVPGGAPAVAISPQQLKQVLDVSRMLAVTTDLDLLLNRIAQAATALLSCERASIFLHDPKTHELWTKVALQTKEIRIASSVGIAGHAFTANQILHVSRPYDDPRFNPEPDRRSGFVTRNLLTLPMVDAQGKPVGVLQAVNKTATDFTDDDKALGQLLSDQAGVAIQRYQWQVAAMESVAMKREMELARKVQEAILPKACPDVPNLHAAGWTRPASTAGGDCFDYWRLEDGRLGIFIADAAGHGIGPALVVSQVRALLRAMCNLERDAHKLMERINSRVAEDFDVGWFVTAFVGFISSDGWLDWCSCGHGPLYVRRNSTEKFQTLDPLVPPLGVMDQLPQTKEPSFKLDSGGMVVITSDGCFEAQNSTGEQFGSDRFAEMLEKISHLPPKQVIETFISTINDWQGKDEPVDDQSILIATRI